MMSERRTAVVAGHGRFAEGIISAVAQVMGEGHGLVAVTNADRTPEGIEQAIHEALDRTGATVLFTDLPAGSCTFVGARLARSVPGLRVITGVSLPMLLSFVSGGTIDKVVEQGQGGIRRIGGEG
jgi:mannose/fructose-specific phosphotransferase system component IIA